jgi:alcohol dehydrogenase
LRFLSCPGDSGDVVESGKLQPGRLVTHRFAMNDIMQAYEVFGNAASEGALKVVLKSDRT